MTESDRPADDPPEPTDFDWASPRWREADATSPEDQRGRRFRGNVAPRQRGAIDAGGSVPTANDVVATPSTNDVVATPMTRDGAATEPVPPEG